MPLTRTRCAITLGDGAGVGPELVLQALASDDLTARCQLIVYGNRVLLERVAERLATRIPENVHICTPSPDGDFSAGASLPTDRHILLDYPFGDASLVAPGIVQRTCGEQAYRWICAATHDVLSRKADALVTAPINKEALHLAGIPFPGHTEILADLAQTPGPCMMFHSQPLIISLATIHIPLSDVPTHLTCGDLLRTIALTQQACQAFGKASPRLGILALNPHAGENGLFGTEEQTVISPAIEKAQAAGINASGPLVPDTAFTWLGTGAAAPFDAYVSMYHDQALIPFKMVAFNTGVNVTLGLPLIRTSPDHGTAFDLAWTGKASPESFFRAILLAERMARQQRPDRLAPT